ncbi:MAG: hypothetical protein AAF490_17555 [Chloroflexota bacterium]
MISIHREAPTESLLRAKRYHNNQASIRDWLRFKIKRDRWKIPKFEDEYINGSLAKTFKNKCAFCESIIGPEESTLAFYRPFKNSVDDRSLTALQKGAIYYRWLNWEWANLYLACKKCEEFRQRQFPIEGSVAPIGLFEVAKLNEYEKPLLLDPCFDQPEKHFSYHINKNQILIVEKNNSKRSRKTIEVFGLNRRSLASARYQEYTRFKQICSQGISNSMWSECKNDKLFAGMKRFFITQSIPSLSIPEAQKRAIAQKLKEWKDQLPSANQLQVHFKFYEDSHLKSIRQLSQDLDKRYGADELCKMLMLRREKISQKEKSTLLWDILKVYYQDGLTIDFFETLSKTGSKEVQKTPDNDLNLYKPTPQSIVEVDEHAFIGNKYNHESNFQLTSKMIPKAQKIALKEKIETSFNINELIEIYWELDIQYENIPQNSYTRRNLSIELIDYCERHNSLESLLNLLIKKRPNEQWVS